MTTPTTVISGSAPGASTSAPMSSSGGAESSPSSCQGGRAASAAPAPAAAPPQARVPPLLRLRYSGVRQLPGGGGWAARVLVDPERQLYREVGPFPDEHAAALAHDRVAIAYLGDRARANFLPAFHPIEQRFLRVCREQEAGGIDVCALVAGGTYEARYEAFLRTVLWLEQWGQYLNVVVDFFIARAVEIGEEALVEGGEKLTARFVEMHRNKATNPGWRAWYINKVLYLRKRKEEEELRRDGQGGAATAAPQPQPEEQQQWKRQRREGGSGSTRAVQPQQQQQQP